MSKEIYWNKALERTNRCIQEGKVIPIKTKDITNEIYYKKDFIIRKIDTKKFKPKKDIGPEENPFSPWDESLKIAEIGSKHHLILNKYPVQRGHILLITNEWKPQEGWLEVDDWSAIQTVNKDTSGLWFFNSGPLAGASQPHRHIQLLRRLPNELNCPREQWFINFERNNRIEGKLTKNIITKKFNFDLQPSNLYDVYIQLAKGLGLGDPIYDTKPLSPYNLLITNRWIAIIKRTSDYVHGFSINALGFAGYILVTDHCDRLFLNQNGPEKLLECFI